MIFEVCVDVDRPHRVSGFARMVSAGELAGAFTPAADEIVWAREKATTDQHLLALVVWFGCHQRLRSFPR